MTKSELITLSVCSTVVLVILFLVWCPPTINVRVISVTVGSEQVLKKAK